MVTEPAGPGGTVVTEPAGMGPVGAIALGPRGRQVPHGPAVRGAGGG